MDIIFWFSGTGNSLYAAKRLSERLGNFELFRITEQAPSGVVGGGGSKVGFVFPSYFGNLPRAVRAFVEKLEFNPDTYIFTVVTMGMFGQGSVGALNKALKSKGSSLNYGASVRMPANYVVNYNPADPAKSAKSLAQADERLEKTAAEISSGALLVKTVPFTANNLYRNIEKLDAGFTVSDACTVCNLCEEICPVANVRMKDGKPTWQHRCEHCMACISLCPAKAIDYKQRTQTRRRYINPYIKAEDFK